MTLEKLNIKIWSDVMCPFCYIGKRRFENALAKFKQLESLQITWKSFNLYPELQTDTLTNIKQFLKENKNISEEQANQLMNSAGDLANEVGLNFKWEQVVVANTIKSHQLLHLAEKHGNQNALKERFFKAYFEEGKNIDDIATLIKLSTEVGLGREEVISALESERFLPAVNYDIQEARKLGVSGVPFFVFNRKYAISGAQSEAYFLQVLETAYLDWKNPKEAEEIANDQQGNSCTPGGGCC